MVEEAAPEASWQAPDARRLIQLGLAVLWLLDAVLQCQSFMFTRMFGRTLAAAAPGNPILIAGPIGWAAQIIERHSVPANLCFAGVQLFLAAGIAWRPAIKPALAASIAWALVVWWLGEGLGGVVAGTASPVTGAPGAVILYALLAVLLWPAERDNAAPFLAGRAVGRRAAMAVWLVLWGSLAWLAVTAASRAPRGLHDMITLAASGEPGWLAAVGNGAAGLVAQHGQFASVMLAAVLAIIAVAPFLPVRAARTTLIAAIIIAAVIWVAGEDFGGIFTGTATDPNTGPILALFALAYWPRRTQPARAIGRAIP